MHSTISYTGLTKAQLDAANEYIEEQEHLTIEDIYTADTVTASPFNDEWNIDAWTRFVLGLTYAIQGA